MITRKVPIDRASGGGEPRGWAPYAHSSPTGAADAAALCLGCHGGTMLPVCRA